MLRGRSSATAVAPSQTPAHVPGLSTIDVPRDGLYAHAALKHKTLMALHMFGLIEERGYLINNEMQLLGHADGAYSEAKSRTLSCPTVTDSNNAMVLRIQWVMNDRGRTHDVARFTLIPQDNTDHAEALARRSILPDAREVPEDAACPRRLGSSLWLVRHLGKQEWTYAEMVDLHRLAFFDLVPGALWARTLSMQFENVVKRLHLHTRKMNKDKAAIRAALDELVESIRQRAQWSMPLASAEDALRECLKLEPALDQHRLQEQIKRLRQAFQAVACATLRDWRRQVYEQQEQLTMQWMAGARAKAPALPEEAFHLLDDAPDDLVVALHEHQAAVVKAERRFEGGEAVCIDPRWLA